MNERLQSQAIPVPTPSFAPIRGNLLQRKCACGGTPGLDGECAECSRKRLLGLQRRSADQAKPAEVPSIVYDELRSSGQQRTGNDEAALPSIESTSVEYDFGRIPVYASVPSSMQPKMKVGTPGDRYEQEADHVAGQAVQQRSRVGGAERFQSLVNGERASEPSNQIDAEPGPRSSKSQIEPGSNLGKPLESSTREEMSRTIGFDFSNVRIHTDALSVYANKGLNARAFTHGSDIYFNEEEYRPNTLEGRRLLAHELTHVVQQANMPDGSARRKMIQCTSIGEVLDEFFSPFSSERLWVMNDNDNYTKIVRTWQPVIDAVNEAKAKLAANCANWQANHMTDPSWRPGMTDPPVRDPNADRVFVKSPLGTDPDACMKAFIVYATTKFSPLIFPLPVPPVETFALYTCSIGSFNIYATVDSIDCAAQTARMNIWMYNAMSKKSFGKFASNPAFRLSGMEKQYMWWNWSESHSWGPSGTTGGGGPAGRSSEGW
jgi:hypothetical protein